MELYQKNADNRADKFVSPYHLLLENKLKLQEVTFWSQKKKKKKKKKTSRQDSPVILVQELLPNSVQVGRVRHYRPVIRVLLYVHRVYERPRKIQLTQRFKTCY